MRQQRVTQSLPLGGTKPKPNKKSRFGPPGWMSARQQVTPDLLLFDNSQTRPWKPAYHQLCARMSNGPKPGGGMRRLEAAS